MVRTSKAANEGMASATMERLRNQIDAGQFYEACATLGVDGGKPVVSFTVADVAKAVLMDDVPMPRLTSYWTEKHVEAYEQMSPEDLLSIVRDATDNPWMYSEAMTLCIVFPYGAGVSGPAWWETILQSYETLETLFLEIAIRALVKRKGG
jgi:hypothetical protein